MIDYSSTLPDWSRKISTRILLFVLKIDHFGFPFFRTPKITEATWNRIKLIAFFVLSKTFLTLQNVVWSRKNVLHLLAITGVNLDARCSPGKVRPQATRASQQRLTSAAVVQHLHNLMATFPRQWFCFSAFNCESLFKRH